jgi:hypothetical protein
MTKSSPAGSLVPNASPGVGITPPRRSKGFRTGVAVIVGAEVLNDRDQSEASLP